MKKLIALFMCFVVVSSAYAKNDKDRNEFSIVYGQATVPQFAYVMGEVFGAMFSLGHASFENPHMFGAAGVEYVHYTNDWFGFGGTVLCDYMTAKTVSVDKDGNKTPNGDFKLGCLSAMPLVKQATPVGVDFGGEQFRGFLEVGVGWQGIVSGGVRWFF